MFFFGRVGSSWGHRAFFGSSWGEKSNFSKKRKKETILHGREKAPLDDDEDLRSSIKILIVARLIHMAYSSTDMYSDSTAKRKTVGGFLLFKEIGLFPRNIYTVSNEK
jgi:hypothetical protein